MGPADRVALGQMPMAGQPGQIMDAPAPVLAAAGLRAYLLGKKAEAADDLATAAEEIASRLATAAAGFDPRPS